MKTPEFQCKIGVKHLPESIFKDFVYRFFPVGIMSVKTIAIHSNDAKIEKVFCKDTLDNPWLP